MLGRTVPAEYRYKAPPVLGHARGVFVLRGTARSNTACVGRVDLQKRLSQSVQPLQHHPPRSQWRPLSPTARLSFLAIGIRLYISGSTARTSA